MDELKTNIIYLGLYLEGTQKLDRGIKIFLAIASSSSIALWAVWQEFPMVWGGIIAASQLLNAVKEYLPYQKRAKNIAGLSSDLQDLFLHAEKTWYSISEGMLTEQKIHESWIDLKKRKNTLIKKNLGSETLPQNKKYLTLADEEKVQYFKNFYIGE